MQQQKAYEKLLQAVREYNLNNEEQIDFQNEVLNTMNKKSREEFSKMYEQQQEEK